MRSLILGARAAKLVGIDLSRFVRTLRGVPRFSRDLIRFREESSAGSDAFPLKYRDLLPMLTDFDEEAGVGGGQYFFQDLWAARRVFAARPARHVDVGSRIDGFVTHLLTFMQVEVVDIRPLTSTVDGLTFIQADATSLSGIESGSVPSLSSLHAVEHFGLGRYGDPISPEGWRQGMGALARVLAPQGRLYFSVPVGRERLRFNAQRVFDPRRVVDTFGELEFVGMGGIDDAGRFLAECSLDDLRNAHNACGLFEFRKP
ncbi:MAG: DUF268 domain-containing protein [Polyangiaceae bacterium]